MAAPEPIRIDGLKEFTKNLKALDDDLPKAVRLAGNEAAGLVVDWARPRVPKRSGRAARTVKARSTRTQARVSGGSRRVPYYPWLDFGGRVGRSRSVRRPFIREGRYIYAGFMRQKDEVYDAYVRALVNVARSAGVEVSE